MKIWYSFAGEHSTNMRIVGHFTKEEDAQKAANLLNQLVNAEDKSVTDGYKYSDEVTAIFQEHGFDNFNEADFQELDYISPVVANGKEIIFDSQDVVVSAITRIFYFYGAKIEIYNRDRH
jgi:Family of unknown function (DUF6375)